MAANIKGQTPHSEYFFEFGSESEQHFLTWHHYRHHTYDLLMSQRGTTLPPLDLKGKVDSDWLKRHADRHNTLRRLTGGTGASLVGLVDVNWGSEPQVADWLRLHSIDHAKLDAFFLLP